ncbi:aldehyde dehydrogenase (NADP(+)) [Actinoalloteichus caeruleus]|uniref:aldehyde dehydrogenase (NADP(+)) n=1 Tax=Actinoalloteichus cyanogriseus TaxID=2893586 RepID=UPI003BB96D4B
MSTAHELRRTTMPSTRALTGANLIAGEESTEGPADLRQTRPATGEQGPAFHQATVAEVRAATAAAALAAPVYAATPATTRAELLRRIATGIEGAADELVAAADEETALGETRLRGELARTNAQLRMFADLIASGAHLDATIDTPDPSAIPPRPDLRRLQVPLGPVAVFSASNFPFAFSVAGGDTASALAAGSPVVLKAHPAHPATSELTGRIVVEAVADSGLPAGVFALLHGAGPEVGQALVIDPAIKAVGFTGSLRAGRALHDAAAARPEPIPVYAEMGSTNPVLLSEAAVAARAEEIAAGLAQSFTMGNGQFCTKPGIVLLPAGAAEFESAFTSAAQQVSPGTLLSPQIQRGLAAQLAETRDLDGVDVLTEVVADGGGLRSPVVVLRTDVAGYLRHEQLREEHFGPVVVLVEYGSTEDVLAALAEVPGSLTATVHAEPGEEDRLAEPIARLVALSGRLVWNGFPTGVAVSFAQQHGGPYPSTTAAWSTSVGTSAIRRFQRPVAYQAAPAAVLPSALRNENPDGIVRLVNGRVTTDPVTAE